MLKLKIMKRKLLLKKIKKNKSIKIINKFREIKNQIQIKVQLLFKR